MIWWVEYGLIDGTATILGAFRWRWSGHQAAPVVTWVLALIIGCGVVMSGAIWRAASAHFVSELSFYYLFCIAAVSGLQFRSLLVISVLLLCLHLGFSFSLNGANQVARFDFLSGITAIVVLALIAWYLTASRRDAWASGQHFRQLSQQDELTGLLNRRGFQKLASAALSKAKTDGKPLALAVLDLDHFKQFNDEHGHGGGDRALQALAQILSACTRGEHDIVARIGGEEFVVMWVNMPTELLSARTEQLLAAVRALQIRCSVAQAGDARISISVGAVCGTPAATSTLAGLLEAADQLLYAAKAQGRDRGKIGPIPPN